MRKHRQSIYNYLNGTRSKSTRDQNTPDQNQPNQIQEPLTDRR